MGNVPITSIKSYDDQLATGKFKSGIERVYAAVQKYPNLTAGEYSRMLGKKDRIWAARRISFLKVQLGVIKPSGIRHCTAFPTKNRCETFCINEEPLPVKKEYVRILKSEYEELLKCRAQLPHLKCKIRWERERADGQELMSFINKGESL